MNRKGNRGNQTNSCSRDIKVLRQQTGGFLLSGWWSSSDGRFGNEAQPEFPEYLQQGCEVGSAFPRFDSCNGRVRKTTEIGKITLGKLKIMPALNHGSNDLGDGFNFVKVFPDFRICFSNVVFIVSPSCHIVSPLSGNPIVALRFCFINFATRCFLRFLAELVEKDVGIILMAEVQHPIIPRTRFPYVIFQMPGNVFAQTGTMILKQLYVLGDLFVLDSGVLICYGFLLCMMFK